MRVSRAEVQAGQFKPRTLALALRELGDAGFVVLEKVLDRALIDTVRAAFRPHFDQHCQKPEVRQHIDAGKKYVGIIRDLRLWHRGAPNLTNDIRTMLAIVYNRPWFHMPPPPLQIPREIWDGMSDSARRIFRENNITG